MDKSPEPNNPSFFKVMSHHDFADILRLPLDFTASLREKLPEYSNLVTESGGSWKVKIEQVAEHLCFTQGWAEFAKDLNLELYDFVVFWFKFPSKFTVAVYGKNCCQKISNPIAKGLLTPKSEPNEGDSESESDDEGNTENEQRASFRVMMKPSHRYKVYIPHDFMKESGILGTMCVVLKDPKRREFPVLLTENSSRGGRNLMTKGWNDFKDTNCLVNGDTCIFTHINNRNGCLINVQIERKDPTPSSKRLRSE